MKTLLRGAVATLTTLLLPLPAANATIINYSATALGGTHWRFDYSIHNDTLGKELDEFTIFFDENLFANLSNATGPSGWDLLLIQPDTAIPSAGFIDGLMTGGGIAIGEILGSFSLTFDYLGSGSPGSQQFSIVDPTSFNELDRGMTRLSSPPGVLPLPDTLPLMLTGLGALAYWRQRRDGGAQ